MIDLSHYDVVFARWRGCRAMVCKTVGNVGDRLIDEATLGLLRHFEIQISNSGDADVVFWSGGGNMGTFYLASLKRRLGAAERATQLGKPLVILPQSWLGEDPVGFHMAFVRELYSRRFCKRGILAPDLALGYRVPWDLPCKESRRSEGFFFREDREKQFSATKTMGDPALLATNLDEYLKLAAGFAQIHTDRLHFAIAGLLTGAHVTLYPNTYHKNIGVWECWLKDLGCDFQNRN